MLRSVFDTGGVLRHSAHTVMLRLMKCGGFSLLRTKLGQTEGEGGWRCLCAGEAVIWIGSILVTVWFLVNKAKYCPKLDRQTTNPNFLDAPQKNEKSLTFLLLLFTNQTLGSKEAEPFGAWLHVVSVVLTFSSARVVASTSLCDWTGACRAPCCGRTCQFPGPRSRPWRRDAPPGWPLSGDGHQTLAPGSCRTEARPGNAPAGSLEQTCPPAEPNKTSVLLDVCSGGMELLPLNSFFICRLTLCSLLTRFTS